MSSERSSFWSRHLAVINFWLDVLLAVLFVLLGWMFGVLQFVFPRGAGPEWKVWGLNPYDWSDGLFVTFCVFAVLVVLHVMLHWEWVCGIVFTKLMGRRTGKDDGSHTLIGVGLLVLIGHVLAAGLLAARVALVGP